MNSKEALKDLREVKGWNDVEFNKRLDIIEKDLAQAEKDKEILRLFKKIIGFRESVRFCKSDDTRNNGKEFTIIDDIYDEKPLKRKKK